MKRFLSGLCATTFAFSFAAATIGPASAAPTFVPKTETAATDVQQIQFDGRLERRGDAYYYNGHRGERDQRRGYRQFEGFWFPPAAFAQRRRAANAHAEWCSDRYRSYRASDNTFRPLRGPRRPCVSPFN